MGSNRRVFNKDPSPGVFPLEALGIWAAACLPGARWGAPLHSSSSSTLSFQLWARLLAGACHSDTHVSAPGGLVIHPLLSDVGLPLADLQAGDQPWLLFSQRLCDVTAVRPQIISTKDSPLGSL